MTLNRREQILAGLVLSLFIVAGTWVGVLSLTDRWQTITRKLAARQRELVAIQTAIEHKPEWLRETERLRQGLGQQEQRFEDMSDVIAQLNKAGSASGVLISNRRPLPVVERGTYRELPIQYTFEATTESLVHFLYALQTGTGFMAVEQLQVAPRPDNPSILRGEIQLRALTGQRKKASS